VVFLYRGDYWAQSTWTRTCFHVKRSGCKSGRGDVQARGKQSRRWFVAKVIEFYIPNNFREKTKRTPVEQRGQVIEFDSLKKKSA
jgi:hypothetical protein